jgi:ribulose-5-phosphate 4-epimerase/fuculose-1-phosphate aldolase
MSSQPILKILEYPTFASVEEERRHRKERLAAAFRIFGRLGFSEGIAGHITARDPEYRDRFWVNPLGKHFSLMRVSDLILVNHQGEILHGDKPINAAAFAIHLSALMETRDLSPGGNEGQGLVILIAVFH